MESCRLCASPSPLEGAGGREGVWGRLPTRAAAREKEGSGKLQPQRGGERRPTAAMPPLPPPARQSRPKGQSPEAAAPARPTRGRLRTPREGGPAQEPHRRSGGARRRTGAGREGRQGMMGHLPPPRPTGRNAPRARRTDSETSQRQAGDRRGDRSAATPHSGRGGRRGGVGGGERQRDRSPQAEGCAIKGGGGALAQRGLTPAATRRPAAVPFCP